MSLWIVQDAEDRYRLEPVDALTPEKIFAARWAMALLGEAMNRLRQEYASRHKMATVEALKAFLDTGNSKNPPSFVEYQRSSGRISAADSFPDFLIVESDGSIHTLIDVKPDNI